MAVRTLLREAIEQFQAGDRSKARVLLAQTIATEPENENAWLWYAYVQESDEKSIAVLQQAAQLHPDWAGAEERLRIYEARHAQRAGTGDQPISTELAQARRELLDLTLRNPLLNYRLLKTRGVELLEPGTDQVFELLVTDSRTLSFSPAADESDEEDVEGEPKPDPVDNQLQVDPIGQKHRSGSSRGYRLRTAHNGPDLEKRLRNTYYTARTYIEEQGVNALFMVFGMLKWYESPDSDTERFAPLVLVPVEISRTDVRSQFRVRYTEEELSDNLSLRAKLKTEFGLELPPFPDLEDLRLLPFLSLTAQAIGSFKRWQVDTTAITLG